MRLKLSLLLPRGETRDIALSCDVTATVADTARALIRTGFHDNAQFEEIARERLEPVTLRGRPELGAPLMLLDPGSPLGASGLQSGWIVEPVLEFGPDRDGRETTHRIIEIAGHVEVLSGRQAGARFSLIAGRNLVGRDRNCRVHLVDPSVSRRHAALDIGVGHAPDDVTSEGMMIRDLGSANHIFIDGEEVTERMILGACTLALGDIELRVTPGPPIPPAAGATWRNQAPPELRHRVLHMRSPRITPRFPDSVRALPAPPATTAPTRTPMLGMLTPVMLGILMFAFTRSAMSLVVAAFSPLMMIASWCDDRFGGARRLRRELRQFRESLRAERSELAELREREIETRAAEAPDLIDIATAITAQGSLLWARRPEHRSFLEVRFGDGTLPSRTRIELPERGECAREAWEELERAAADLGEIAPVPVLERLDRCGAIGVTGEAIWAEGLLRALMLQLTGLHSPTELTVACFSSARRAEGWAWLKWLPHIDPVTSPLPVWQLADEAAGSARLVAALEDLIETRGSGDNARQREAGGESPNNPAVVVLVLDDTQVDAARLIAIAESGPDLGVYVIWLGRTTASLPAVCRTFVEAAAGGARVSFVRSAKTVALQRLEFLEAAQAQRLARVLAPIEDASSRALDESDLPKSVDLRELHKVDLLGGEDAILRAWERSGTLTSLWRPGADREATAMEAIVGQSSEGPVSIDLRVQGPHALVGGTTGSGKSEFLQTWIMSLAARISPERVSFLLVDYKGGAAFAECADLPHTVGLVTDLTPHLVRRALTSLRAELRRREDLLARHAAKDLLTMERRSDPAAPPALIIVIDEFSALAAEVPEFVDGVIDISQRGRSLGLHLIMATQRPAGVIKDSIRANTNLRVALRMADEAESSDVIGIEDAAFFETSTPGRGAFRVGPGRITHFQTGYLGRRAAGDPHESPIDVRAFGFAEGESWPTAPESRSSAPEGADEPRDIERLRDGIIEAARIAGLGAPRRPWLDPLPETIDLRALSELDASAVGLRDRPADQAQDPFGIDLEVAGNVSIFGASGTGKTSALITLAASLSVRAEHEPAHIYAIDAGGGMLRALSALPTVGAVAPLSDTELTGRVLRRLLEVVAERGPRFAALGAGSLAEYRRDPARAPEPRVVLLLDGFGAFRQACEATGGPESPLQLLSEIMMRGRAVGVHVVLSCDRAAAVPSAMASSVQQQYVLRLANPHDYGYLGVRADALEGAPPGRALLAGNADEVQFALIDGNSDFAAQTRALEHLGSALRDQGVAQSVEVRNAPEVVHLQDLPEEAGGRPVFGIGTLAFEPVTMPVSGLGVIAGPAGSGQSSAVLGCVAALGRWARRRGEGVESVLLTLSDDGLRLRDGWDRVAFGDGEVCELARRLVPALTGRPPTARRGRSRIGVEREPSAHECEPLAFPGAEERGVIVVERPGDAENAEALPALISLAKAARRADVLVLFEFEQGAANSAWELLSALKRPRWGVALQPDESESHTPFREEFGRVRRTDFPPGRGSSIEAGRAVPVQVALPPLAT